MTSVRGERWRCPGAAQSCLSAPPIPMRPQLTLATTMLPASQAWWATWRPSLRPCSAARTPPSARWSRGWVAQRTASGCAAHTWVLPLSSDAECIPVHLSRGNSIGSLGLGCASCPQLLPSMPCRCATHATSASCASSACSRMEPPSPWWVGCGLLVVWLLVALQGCTHANRWRVHCLAH